MMENPGVTIGSGGLTPSEVREASSSVDITQRASKGVRPNITGNPHDVTGGRIDRPSSRLAARLDDTKHKQELAKDTQKRQVEAAALQPESLRRDLEALRRSVKRLEKALKEATDATA